MTSGRQSAPPNLKPSPASKRPANFEHAAHQAQRDHIRQARETGSSWSQIGQALDLFWHAIASKESIADEAYDYAIR